MGRLLYRPLPTKREDPLNTHQSLNLYPEERHANGKIIWNLMNQNKIKYTLKSPQSNLTTFVRLLMVFKRK
jgi:hypothetical protein